jgi:hypothetical protein
MTSHHSLKTGNNICAAPCRFVGGSQLVSPNGAVLVVLQSSDNNFVLYHNSKAGFSTGAAANVAFVQLEANGRFHTLDAQGNSVWIGYAGDANSSKQYFLAVEDSGHLVLRVAGSNRKVRRCFCVFFFFFFFCVFLCLAHLTLLPPTIFVVVDK